MNGASAPVPPAASRTHRVHGCATQTPLPHLLQGRPQLFAEYSASHGQAPAGATEPTEQQILEAAFAPAQPAAEASRFGSPELQAMIIARCVEKDQADSVPAVSDLPPLPAPDLRDVGTKPQEIKEFLKGYATEYARTAIAARAPADSVQEDAARYRWLCCKFGETRFPCALENWLEHGYIADGKPSIDAAIDAARKQGGAT